MTFEKRLSAKATVIDRHFEEMLGTRAAETECVPPRLASAMRHAVMAGGKRIRPFLLLESAAVLDIEPEAAMPAALALELVHCYSLVHDDLPAMDNDELRRGLPTVWKAFDDWTAILAGDALLTLAFEQLARLPATAPGTSSMVRATLIEELARAAGRGGMVGGQCLDLEADKLGTPSRPSLSHIDRLQGMKTGALFRFACLAGALLGDATPAEMQALTRYGEQLGTAFQLADDLLDVEGEAATVGKATGKDAAAGKATVVSVLGVAEARKRLTALEVSAHAELETFGPRADVLREALEFAVNRSR